MRGAARVVEPEGAAVVRAAVAVPDDPGDEAFHRWASSAAFGLPGGVGGGLVAAAACKGRGGGRIVGMRLALVLVLVQRSRSGIRCTCS